MQPLEGSALLTTGANEQASLKSLAAAATTENKKPDTKGTGKSNLICNYRKKNGHTKENCWKLHGRPQNHNQSNRNWGGKNWQQRDKLMPHRPTPIMPLINQILVGESSTRKILIGSGLFLTHLTSSAFNSTAMKTTQFMLQSSSNRPPPREHKRPTMGVEWH